MVCEVKHVREESRLIGEEEKNQAGAIQRLVGEEGCEDKW